MLLIPFNKIVLLDSPKSLINKLIEPFSHDLGKRSYLKLIKPNK
jgi:hypothetical protein